MAAQAAPALFSDNLFNTSILPSTTTNPGGNKKNPLANFNGTNWSYTETGDDDKGSFIFGVNTTIGALCYSGTPGKWDCLFDSGVYPCRYVVMHSVGGAEQNSIAHQLIVTAPGVSTFLTTDWRSPPLYERQSV